jgi:hypothetical protein
MMLEACAAISAELKLTIPAVSVKVTLQLRYFSQYTVSIDT